MSLSVAKSRPHINWEWFSSCVNDILAHIDIKWYKFEDRWADVFQIYPNAIHFNPRLLCLSSSKVLSSYFDILDNSMTIWSALKLPKIAWPSPFKMFRDETLGTSFFSLLAYNFDRRCSSQQWNFLWQNFKRFHEMCFEMCYALVNYHT